VGWALLLKGIALVFGGSALALRSLPCAFGCLGMHAALRAGRRFATHPLGGALALAAVAFDPLEIGYARTLKQYTAEAFFCLVALDPAAVFAGAPRRWNLVVLSGVRALGVLFANSQLFLAPPIFAALAVDAHLRRDRQRATPVLMPAAGISVGYVPLPPDPRIAVVNDGDLVERAEAALRTGARVWVLASAACAPRGTRARVARVPRRERARPPSAGCLSAPARSAAAVVAAPTSQPSTRSTSTVTVAVCRAPPPKKMPFTGVTSA